MRTLLLKKNSHPESKLACPAPLEGKAGPAESRRRTGGSSWYRWQHHGSVTVSLALGDLGFALSSRAWWKSGFLALQGMQWRGR